jgi:hypothetical protein
MSLIPLIDNSLVVEIKAVDKFLPIHSAQLITYMRFTFSPTASRECCSDPPFPAASVSSVLPW